MKTLSSVAKPGGQLRPEARGPFFRRQSQPGSTFFAPAVQARLKVSQPGDPHEVEADRMAEHVMRTLSEPFFAPASPASSAPVPAISRVPTPPSAAAMDEEPAAKEEEETSDSILRMADPWFSGGANDDESAPESPPIQRRAMGPASLAIGALPVSHFAAQSRANSRKALVPAQATISSGWVTRTPARSRPDRARGPPGGGESFTNLLSQSKGRGQPLSKKSRAEMEPAFGADFGVVRVHKGDEAHSLANRASALAFAHGGDIYFGRGQFQPDTTPGRRLLAHELTHVVQQGRAVQRSSIQRSPFASSLAQRSNHARAPPQISSAEPHIQRLGWNDIKEEINSYAELIHGFTLMTVVVGYNPILDQDVEWSAKNFFRGAAGLIPFGTLVFDKLDEAGVIDSVFAWITSQIDAHNLSLSRVNSLFDQAWDQMDFVRLDPTDYNLEVVRSTFSGLLSDVADFASACADKLIEAFKDLAIKAVRAFFGENAPSYDLICQILGQDPLTGETREWNTADFLRSVLRLFGFENHLAKMEETGQVEKAAAWIDAQVGLLLSAYSGLIFGVIDLWTSLSLEKLLQPDQLLTDTLNIVLTYVGKLSLFAFNLASKVLELIKEALITLLKAHVHKVPGYPLFTVVLGMDPVTGEEVPRTPENFLKGFLSFVPKGIETYENIKASGALPRAMEWLLSLINELGLSPSQLLERFLTLWNSFSIDDLMNPIGAYIRVAETYLTFVGNVLMLVLRVYWKVLEIMFVFLLGPGAARVVAALKQAENTFRLIIEDPVGFFANLLAAIGKGIKQFGSNIWKHIQGGLIGWMLGSLQGAGIEMPEKFDLQGVVSIVMQLLGLTYRQIRPILVKRLGENVVENLEKTFEFLRVFLTEGFAGVWRQFLEWVGDLKGIVIQAVTEWVVTKIVMVGLSKLATLWNPVGWAVEAVLAIYYTIMFFIERMEQILDFVEAVIQSINNIATGKLQQAADYVENAMARTIPVIIGFCTSLIGLGGVSSKIRGVIQKVQDKIHKAIDKMIDWIVEKAKGLFKKAVEKGKAAVGTLARWMGFDETFEGEDGKTHRLYIAGDISHPLIMVASTPEEVERRLEKAQFAMKADESLSEEDRKVYNNYFSSARGDLTEIKKRIASNDGRQDDEIVKKLQDLKYTAGHFFREFGGMETGFDANEKKEPRIEIIVSREYGSFQRKGSSKFDHGYISHLPLYAKHEKSPATVARQYLTEGFDKEADANQRFAQIIGVNMVEDPEGMNRETVRTVVTGAGWPSDKFPLGVIGFIWTPPWSHQNKEITDDIKSYFASLPTKGDKARMLEEHQQFTKFVAANKAYAYGSFRDTVKNHSYTNDYISEMRERAENVFIHSGDPDVVNLRAAGDSNEELKRLFGASAETVGQGLFNRYDAVLKKAKAEHNGEYPLIISGGYHFEFTTSTTVEAAFATVLASILDMRIREAMAAINPAAVYYPEPNTLFNVSGDESRGYVLDSTYGIFKPEGQTMTKTLMERSGDEFTGSFDSSAAFQTSADARFVLEEGAGALNLKVRTRNDILIGYFKPDPEKIFAIVTTQEQSHAKPETWANSVGTALGLDYKGTTGNDKWQSPLRALYNTYLDAIKETLTSTYRMLSEKPGPRITETRLSKEMSKALVILNLNSIDISGRMDSLLSGIERYFAGLDRALTAKQSQMTPLEHAEAKDRIAAWRATVPSKARDQVVPMAISALSVIKQFIVNGLKR